MKRNEKFTILRRRISNVKCLFLLFANEQISEPICECPNINLIRSTFLLHLPRRKCMYSRSFINIFAISHTIWWTNVIVAIQLLFPLKFILVLAISRIWTSYWVRLATGNYQLVTIWLKYKVFYSRRKE